MATGQWWNIWILSNNPQQQDSIIEHTIQSATKPVQGAQAPASWGGPGQIFTVNGPYASKAQATGTSAKNHGPAPGSTGAGGAPNPLNFSLSASGIGGWFVRALKVLFGGILIILGVSRLTGVDNKVVQLATKAPVPL